MHIKSLFGNSDQRLEHQRLTSLVNSMADAVLAVDQDVNVVLYNAAALGILDLNTISPGAPLAELFKPIDKDGNGIDIHKMISETTVPIISRDMKLKYGDSSLINLYLSIAPVHLGYGKDSQAGYVLMLRDITREKSLEEEREEFISVVSHELRTPIAVTEGNISNAQLIVQKGGSPAEIQKALDEAHNQIVFLSDMINDLATLSRAERNQLGLEVTDINIPQLINGLLANYAPGAQAKGLGLLAAVDPNVPNLRSSELYVKEILQNFITNAIKYTAQGTVTVKAVPSSGGVTFTVKDTGIGISKNDQEKVFDKFFRSEDFRTRQANGTGLGLYITTKLAHRISAKIAIDSEPDKGSTFTVEIPNLETSQTAPVPVETPSQSPEPAQAVPSAASPSQSASSEEPVKTESPA